MEQVLTAKGRSQCDDWEKLCEFVRQEQFEPVAVIDDGESIQFDYSSPREKAWMIGTAVSGFLAFVLISVLSIPFAFLITLLFVFLARSTDDYLKLDRNQQAVIHVNKFLGKVSQEQVLPFDEVSSIVVRAAEQKSGQSKWTEYWLELQDTTGQTHSLLTHPDARNEKRAVRIGAAVADLVRAPLSTPGSKPQM